MNRRDTALLLISKTLPPSFGAIAELSLESAGKGTCAAKSTQAPNRFEFRRRISHELHGATESQLIKDLLRRGLEDFVKDPSQVSRGNAHGKGGRLETGALLHPPDIPRNGGIDPLPCGIDRLQEIALRGLQNEQAQFHKNMLETNRHARSGMFPIAAGLLRQKIETFLVCGSQRNLEASGPMGKRLQCRGHKKEMEDHDLRTAITFTRPPMGIAGREDPEMAGMSVSRSLRMHRSNLPPQYRLKLPGPPYPDENGLFRIVAEAATQVDQHKTTLGT